MGNTLTCCVKPDASPTLGRRPGPAAPDDESEVYEAAAGDAVAVAPSPAALEPAELDLGTGEGHHLQHISDRELPDGKGAAGGGGSRGASGPGRAQGSREGAAASGPFLPGAGFPGAGTARRPRPLLFSASCRPVSLLAPSTRFLPPVPFSAHRPARHGFVECRVGL